MERIRFHPESCKWVKKKISEFERKKRKKERREGKGRERKGKEE